jgi:S-adenosylmethionine:tRNA-ribosyltransferase-isomerase (queuine synthetase)
MQNVIKLSMQRRRSCCSAYRRLHNFIIVRLEIKRVKFAEVHVGLGTFNPVEVEDLSKHGF